MFESSIFILTLVIFVGGVAVALSFGLPDKRTYFRHRLK